MAKLKLKRGADELSPKVQAKLQAFATKTGWIVVPQVALERWATWSNETVSDNIREHMDAYGSQGDK